MKNARGKIYGTLSKLFFILLALSMAGATFLMITFFAAVYFIFTLLLLPIGLAVKKKNESGSKLKPFSQG